MNLFDKAKEQALKAIDNEIARRKAKNYPEYSIDYVLEHKAKIEALKDFPEDSKALKGVDVKYKAKFLKGQLIKAFPEAVIKVRIEYFSMGSSINAWVDGKGIDEALASKIGAFYSDPGNSDLMSDYFDYDNYVSVMCKDGGVLNSPVVMLGYNMPN